MSKVDLPLLGMDAGVQDAIEAMKQSGRGGLVLESEGPTYRLIDGANVMIAASRGVVSLSSIDGWREMQPNSLERAGLISRARKVKSGRTFQLRTVTVDDESLAARVAREILFYYCNGARRHGFLPNQVRPGEPCPYGDGVIVG